MTTNLKTEAWDDRVELAIQRWRTSGDVLWRGSRLAYQALAPLCAGRTVVDVGCGVGAGTAVLATTAKSARGIDRQQSAISFARSMNPLMPLEVWDITLEPYPGVYDDVVCVEVIEHIREAGMALRCMMAMSKSIWLTTPEREAGEVTDPRHVREYTWPELVALVESTGQEVKISGGPSPGSHAQMVAHVEVLS